MKVVQELVTYFDTRGKLSRPQLRKLLDHDQVAADAPSNMNGLCDVLGVTEGQVWGTDTYTRDSLLGAAAVHAGLLKAGQTGVLRMTVVAPLEKYPGTVRNGVTTSDYATFPHCWTLSAI
jgi:LCCL domain